MVGTRVIMGAKVISVFMNVHTWLKRTTEKSSAGQYFKGLQSYHLENIWLYDYDSMEMDGIGEIISLHIRSTLLGCLSVHMPHVRNWLEDTIFIVINPFKLNELQFIIHDFNLWMKHVGACKGFASKRSVQQDSLVSMLPGLILFWSFSLVHEESVRTQVLIPANQEPYQIPPDLRYFLFLVGSCLKWKPAATVKLCAQDRKLAVQIPARPGYDTSLIFMDRCESRPIERHIAFHNKRQVLISDPSLYRQFRVWEM